MPTWITAKSSFAFLVILVFSVVVVRSGEISSVVLALVTFVNNNKVVTSSESWAPIFVIANSVFWFSESHFLFEIELEEERTVRIVSYPFVVYRAPFEWGVACNNFSELSTNDGHCVADIITKFMELSR